MYLFIKFLRTKVGPCENIDGYSNLKTRARKILPFGGRKSLAEKFFASAAIAGFLTLGVRISITRARSLPIDSDSQSPMQWHLRLQLNHPTDRGDGLPHWQDLIAVKGDRPTRLHPEVDEVFAKYRLPVWGGEGIPAGRSRIGIATNGI